MVLDMRAGHAAHEGRLTIKSVWRHSGADTNRELTYFYHKDKFIRVVTPHPLKSSILIAIWFQSRENKCTPWMALDNQVCLTTYRG